MHMDYHGIQFEHNEENLIHHDREHIADEGDTTTCWRSPLHPLA